MDGPLGSSEKLQDLKAVRKRSCVRPAYAATWPPAQMGSANDIQSGQRHRTPWNWSDSVIRRFDRSSSLALPLTPRHQRADQATTGCRRYASPRAIMAQIIRAILLARATAATFLGRRSSNCNSHALADLLPGLAYRITAIAPTTSNCRNLSLPALLIPSLRSFDSEGDSRIGC